MNTIVILALALSLVQSPKTPTLQDLRNDLYLVMSVTGDPTKAVEFERKYPKELATTWNPLKKTLSKTDEEYIDLCFFQAYCGVDYRNNLNNLMSIDVKKQHYDVLNAKRAKLTRAEFDDYIKIYKLKEELPDYLYGLYIKRHDKLTLQSLIGFPLVIMEDDVQAACVYYIWKAFPAEIVKSTIGSVKLEKRVGEILAYCISVSNIKREPITSKLALFSKSSDAQFARTARYILKNMPVYPKNNSPRRNLYYSNFTTKICSAVEDNRMEEVKELLRLGADVNSTYTHGTTLLMMACIHENLELVKLLLKSGADTNYCEFMWGGTALVYAAGHENPELAELLLDHGAKINGAVNGYPPIVQASERGYMEVLKLLLGRGANINARSGIGNDTALIRAAQQNQVDAVKFLVEKGADQSLVNRWGDTVWSSAHKNKNKKILELLKPPKK